MTTTARAIGLATLLIALCVIGLGTSQAHEPLSADEPDSYDLRTVRHALRDPELALGMSVTEKQINRLGDRLAIALIKIYSESELTEPATARRYLPLIRAAFVAPQIVRDPSDRKPAVTMLLLRRLEDTSTDESERRQVRETISFVQAKTTSL